MTEPFDDVKVKITGLLSAGQIGAAVASIRQAYDDYEEAREDFAYAAEYAVILGRQVDQFAGWEGAGQTLEDFLLERVDLGEDDATLISSTLGSFGAVKHFLGLDEQAIDLLEEAVGVREDTVGMKQACLPHWVEYIGLSYRRTGNRRAAKEWERRHKGASNRP